jgi:hypothetical protein
MIPSSTMERIGNLEDECRRLHKENEDLKKVLINAGHALCASSAHEGGWRNDGIVMRQIRDIEKLTGCKFR